MTQFINPTNFNPAALVVPDVYALAYPPQSFIQGVSQSVLGQVGTASWGPVDTPIIGGSIEDLIRKLGTISAASVDDPHDIATAATLSLSQVQGQSGLTLVWVRCTDGTDTRAAGQMASAAVANSSETATFAVSVTSGQILTITITRSDLPGGNTVLTRTSVGGDTLTTIAAAFAALVNANEELFARGIIATSSGAVLTVKWITAAGAPTFTKNEGTGNTTITLASSTTGTVAMPGLNLTAYETGVLGDQIVAYVIAGSTDSTRTVTIQSWKGGPIEQFQNIAVATFYTDLKNLLIGGQSATIPGSRLLIPGLCSEVATAPAAGTSFTLSGGTDGRDVDTADLVGTLGNEDGMYALTQSIAPLGGFHVVGLTDIAAVPDIQSMTNLIGCFGGFCFPTGTTDDEAVTAKGTAGIDDPNILWQIDFVQFFDSINNVRRYVDPGAVAFGRIATLAPQVSPCNKPVYGILRTEKDSARSVASIGVLTAAGINFIQNPIVRGKQFGFRNGRNGSSNPATTDVSYTRMTNFLLSSIASNIGQYEGDNVAWEAGDPLMNAIEGTINRFLAELKRQRIIANGLATCDVTNNTQENIGQGIVYIDVQVQYLSVALFLVFRLQGGATVVVSQNVVSNRAVAA